MTQTRILVVEDERIVALHLKQQLVKLGYEVVAVVASGDKALKAISELRPDLLLMDINIEGSTDGIETVARIPKSQEVPVVYLSAYSEAATLERARATRPYGYLVKPFSERDLHATIQMALERYRVDSALQASERRLAILSKNLQGEIAERSRAEEAARENEDRFRSIFGAVSDGIFIADAGSRSFVEINGPGLRMFGYTRRELLGKDIDVLSSSVAPYNRAGAQPWIDKAVTTLKPQTFEWHCKTKDDRLFWAEVSIRFASISGRAAIISIVRDITERRALDDQLRQAQKMEAIGQLTGGIAHDFNNLLAIIHGNLELIRDRVSGQTELKEMVGDALRAAARGANLNHQLLAYSRRQPLEPKIVNIATVVGETTKLLLRTLGGSIEIRAVMPPDLWAAKIDPNQLQNALLNLAVNARDAMPGGGTITIEAENRIFDDVYCEQNRDAKPGSYVQLSVSDTGGGIPRDVIGRVLEPFFTTKAVGEGSGLGLSMVYGFAKQSGGHLKIYSEVGRGTVVSLYFPKVSNGVNELPADEEAVAPGGRGTETILVVEDDEMVRKLAVRILSELGYRTFEAGDGVIAARLLNDEPSINLLLTDVVLPNGVSGPALAHEARLSRPDLKVLFMSGYTGNAIEKGGMLGEGVRLLSKPFPKSELAREVRQILDEGGSA